MMNDVSSLPAALRKRLNDELQRGERLLYAGRPSNNATIAGQIPVLLFAIFWCSICFPMAAMAWAPLFGVPLPLNGKPPTGGMGGFIAVFMIPFVLVGVGLLASIPYSIRRSFKTLHVVTDSRILNIFGGRRQSVESYSGQLLNFVKRHDGRHGRGSLEIAYGVERDSDGDPRPVTTHWRGIPDAKRAETAVLELMRRRGGDRR
jgi:hypothetical protein